jgi:hypothetical protein
MRHTRSYVLQLVALGMMAFASEPADAQTIAPGPYYATPSWDQTLPPSTRFIVLSNFNNEAVLDRETGLVWERSPVGALGTDWFNAVSACERLIVANRLGWRLPSVQELTSLIDPTQSNPALPPGNPFGGIVGLVGSLYWTAATVEMDATAGKVVDFSTGSITQMGKTPIPMPRSGARFLCVRGGSSVSNPPY